MNWKTSQFAKGSKCQITNLQNLQNVLFTKILFNCQVCSSSYWKEKIFVTTFEDFCGFIWWDFIGCFINLQQLDKTTCAEGPKGRESWKPQNPEALASDSCTALSNNFFIHFPTSSSPLICAWIIGQCKEAFEDDLWGPDIGAEIGKEAEEEGKVFFPQEVGLNPRREDPN